MLDGFGSNVTWIPRFLEFCENQLGIFEYCNKEKKRNFGVGPFTLLDLWIYNQSRGAEKEKGKNVWEGFFVKRNLGDFGVY